MPPDKKKSGNFAFLGRMVTQLDDMSFVVNQKTYVNNITCRVQNPDTQRAGWRSAQRTVGQGEAGQNKVPTFRSASRATVPLALQGTINNSFERLSASTNKENPM